jgi:hypothetical protein
MLQVPTIPQWQQEMARHTFGNLRFSTNGGRPL